MTTEEPTFASDFFLRSLEGAGRLIDSDPLRAAESLRDLAEIVRYRSRLDMVFADLADEIRCVDQYLSLAQLDRGDELRVDLGVSPKALPARVPHLCLQSLVEYALEHGQHPGGCHLVVEVAVTGEDILLSVESRGPGFDGTKVTVKMPRTQPPATWAHSFSYQEPSGTGC